MLKESYTVKQKYILVALAVDAEGVVVVVVFALDAECVVVVVYAEGGGVVVTVDPESGGIVVALDAEGVVVVVDAEGGGIVVVVGKVVEHKVKKASLFVLSETQKVFELQTLSNLI